MTPIIFFDLETTGTDVAKDRIVSIALKRVTDLSGFIEDEFYSLVNPGVPIPQGASDVHGITDGTVAGAPTFAELAPSIHERMQGCALAGYNLIEFDVPLLWEEFNRAGVRWTVPKHIIDVGNIFKKKEPRTLSAAVQFYCGRSLDGAHNAVDDVQGTVDVLAG